MRNFINLARFCMIYVGGESRKLCTRSRSCNNEIVFPNSPLLNVPLFCLNIHSGESFWFQIVFGLVTRKIRARQFIALQSL